jgi:hypothetical protein
VLSYEQIECLTCGLQGHGHGGHGHGHGSAAKKPKAIPIPDIREVETHYRDYLPLFNAPITYLHGKGEQDPWQLPHLVLLAARDSGGSYAEDRGCDMLTGWYTSGLGCPPRACLAL